MFDSKSENRDRAVVAVEAVESVSEARAVYNIIGLVLALGLGLGLALGALG